jgi:sulfite exporter TauE/SafE
VALIESELADVAEVARAKASLSGHSVEVTGEFGDKTHEHIAADLTTVLKPHGYALLLEHRKHVATWSDFAIAAPIALVFIAFFIVLQKLGIVNLISGSSVGYGTAFAVGLIASVSTCMAVVGGLVLSMSANFAKEGDKVRPQVLFHVGRLVAFFVLGGAIGALGSAFQLGAIGTFVLSLLVAIVLLLLGINLLDVFPWAKRLQPTMPSFIGKHIHGLKSANHTLTPLLIGVATFFLPCGFTQSMQIYTLTTGSFWGGGIHTKARSGIFFKTAGLVVIFFGLFNLLNALVSISFIPPLFSF